MKNVSLLVPTGFKDRRRHEIYLWVMNRWLKQFPDWQVCIGEDDPTNYNRSKARNDAFRQADGEILVISDADTVTTIANVERAIAQCLTTNAWVIAHKYYFSLTEHFTDWLLQQEPDYQFEDEKGSHAAVKRDDFNWVMTNKSEAGVIVMPREAYEAVEGYDERFKIWGYEDNAFASRLRKKWGVPQRTDGFVAHLWHERGLDFDHPDIEANQKLYESIRDEEI